MLVEAIAGFAIDSLALLADAAHNLTDVAGLLIAWGGRPPSGRFTYGFGRSTIMAALANSLGILVGVDAVVWEAVHRSALPLTLGQHSSSGRSASTTSMPRVHSSIWRQMRLYRLASCWLLLAC